MRSGRDSQTPPGALLTNPLCQSARADGGPCGAPPQNSGYCFFHDPEQRQELIKASRKGGRRRALPLPETGPLHSDEARGLLASVLAALLEGALDPTTARTVAYVLQVERRIAEGSELERKLAVLEDLVGSNGGAA